jgi:pteridine reductase
VTLEGTRPIALVVGGVRRVGLAMARELASSGMDLVLTYRSSEREAHEAEAALSKIGASVRIEQLELEDPDAIESFCAEIASSLPRLDAMVLSASRYEPTPIANLGAAEVMAHFRVNALAPLLLCKHLEPTLARSSLPGGGAIVAMADIHAMGRPRVGYAAYSMSKAALVEMVRSLARELAPAVRINGIAPGVIAWPESGEESHEAAQQRYLDRVPLKRAGTPQDAARLARFLILEATYVTGEIVRLDGGRSLA